MPRIAPTTLTDAQDITAACARIKIHHRGRRFAMKTQQKLNLSLQSYVRVNYTNWEFDASDADKAKSKAEIAAIIKDARSETPQSVAGLALANKVKKIDISCEIWDEEQTAEEKDMIRIVRSLPIAPWVKSIRGAGEKGVATVIGEAGNLSNYPTIEKLWKRLGFAPYDGHAGSTWRRETWRPRALTADEWVANPFTKERYSFMQQNALALWKSQWIGKAGTEDHAGAPNGHYGEIFARRKAHTLKVHLEWYLDKKGEPKVDEYSNPTSAHAQADALRVMYKAFLHDLWREWRRSSSDVTEKSNGHLSDATLPILSPLVPIGACASEHQENHAPATQIPRSFQFRCAL